MQCINKILPVLLVFFNLIACSDQPDAQAYSAAGVSLTIPEHWKFAKDSYYKGNRTISFTTGEFSGATLTIIPEGDADYNSIERSAFVNKRVINILTAGLTESDYKEVRKPISRPPFKGEVVHIAYTSPARGEIEVESYLLMLDKAKIIVIIDTEKVDLPNVLDKIERFLKSISYNSELANFNKDDIH